MAEVTAVVLAGRPNAGALRAVSAAPWEALVEVGGRPMVCRVVEALQGAAGVGDVVVVAPPAVAAALSGVRVAPPGGDLVESLRHGLAAAGAGPVLAAGSDVPLLTPAMVERFLAACAAAGAATCYPVIPRAACEERFPGARRTYARLREGEFTGGNLFYLAPEAVAPVLALLERFYRARKSPLRLAALLGVGVFLRFLAGRLSIRDVERRFRQLTGCAGRAVICPDPEVGMDVDKPEDWRLVQERLTG